MVGGSEQVFQLALLPAMGKKTSPMSAAVGWSTAVCNNQIIVALNIQAVAEALLFAAKNGADLPR
jgi:2-hydroxy-3-oxopropionate reductase